MTFPFDIESQITARSPITRTHMAVAKSNYSLCFGRAEDWQSVYARESDDDKDCAAT
jgi:hypothetical protein